MGIWTFHISLTRSGGLHLCRIHHSSTSALEGHVRDLKGLEL